MRTAIALISLTTAACQASYADQEKVLEILWPGTEVFDQQAKEFSVSIDEAHARLVARTRDHPELYFDRVPTFIVGDEYFFAEPAKLNIPLEGFYVNGRSGAVEYRKSNVAIKAKQKALPANAFSEIQRIE